MKLKKISAAVLSLLLLSGCSSSNADESTMVSLEDYNSYYSEQLATTED